MNELTVINFDSEAKEFINQYKPRSINGKTIGNKNTADQYMRGLTRLAEFMMSKGYTNINQMDLKALTIMQDELLADYKPKTVQTYMGVVKEFFKFLSNKGLLENNAFANLRLISIDKRELKTPVLTESEAARAMSHVMALPDSPNSIINKLIMVIMINTGVREEELTKVKIKDMVKQGDNLILSIKGKGMRKRFVSLSPEVTRVVISLRNKLENAIMAPLSDDDYLIQSMSNNVKGKNVNPMHRTSLHERVQTISNEVGLYFTPHALRRTFATILYKRKTPIEVIQRILGHENTSTTMSYINMEVDKDVGIIHATSMVG